MFYFIKNVGDFMSDDQSFLDYLGKCWSAKTSEAKSCNLATGRLGVLQTVWSQICSGASMSNSDLRQYYNHRNVSVKFEALISKMNPQGKAAVTQQDFIDYYLKHVNSFFTDDKAFKDFVCTSWGQGSSTKFAYLPNIKKVQLLGYWRSGATWRLRLYFNFKGIQYEYVPVNLVKGEQKTEEHAKLNPSKVRLSI